MQRVVVVLGGNAFVKEGDRLTMAGQFQFARDVMRQLRPLLGHDVQLLLSHGNGPQVGHILIRVEEALGKAYEIPLEVCVAESEGELGYVLQQSLYNALTEAGLSRTIAPLLTQVEVSQHDPAFENPSKPIGPFYTEAQAVILRDKGFAVIEDAGRGYRRVVASPQPVKVIEIDAIRALLEMGAIVIAAGGGGIPVVRRDGRLQGVEAVIDKDRTAALLAESLSAQRLIILTGVPCAYRNFNTPQQEPIGRVRAGEAQQLIDQGHFAPGSMLPKMEAAVKFAGSGLGQAIICDPASLAAALSGQAGTIID